MTTQKRYDYTKEESNKAILNNQYLVIDVGAEKIEYNNCVCCNRKLNNKLPVRAVIVRAEKGKPMIKPVLIVGDEYRVYGGVRGEEYSLTSIGNDCYPDYIEYLSEPSVYEGIKKEKTERYITWLISEGEKYRRLFHFIKAFFVENKAIKQWSNKLLNLHSLEYYLLPKEDLVARLEVLEEMKREKVKTTDLEHRIYWISEFIEKH